MSEKTHQEGEGQAAQEGKFSVNHDKFKWYAILAQSGMEKKVKSFLEQRIAKNNLETFFGQIVIPSQTIERIDEKGKKKQVEQKMMPGYIFIQMDMTENAYHCVKDTPKVVNFIGATPTKAPPPLGDDEVDRVLNRAVHVAKEEAAKPRVTFEKGEKVKVIDGPFTNFIGDIDEVKADKAKLRLLISVFGRQTPVEIEFNKVERVTE